MFTKVTPVWPYWSEIRDKMFNHLKIADFTIDDSDTIVVNGTTKSCHN